MLPSYFRHALRRFAPAGIRTPWIRAMLGLLLAAYFVMGFSFLAVRYFVLPQVPQWRPQIEARASAALGLPVQIRAVSADWDGLRPQLRLQGFSMLDASGAPALALKEVRAALGWSSLLRSRVVLHRLELDGPALDIRRDAQGRLSVAGIAVGQGERSGGFADSPFASWLLAQRSVVVHNARLVWTDASRDAPALSLTAVQFRLDNHGERHRFGLSGSPPAQWAGRLEVRGDLNGASGEPLDAWHGRLWLDVPEADLQVWQRWVDYPLAVSGGRGALQLWLSRNAQREESLDARLALRDVDIRLAENLPRLDLAHLGGVLHLARKGGTVHVAAEQLSLAEQGGTPLPAMDFRLQRSAAEGATPAGGKLEARGVEIGALAGLAEHLPLPPLWRQRMAELAPHGRLDQLSLAWQGEAGVPALWHLESRFTGLDARAHEGWPGGSGWSGNIRADQNGGDFTLDVRNGGLDLPEIFEPASVPLTQARFEGNWLHAGGETELHLTRGDFRNADAQGSLNGLYRTQAGSSGYADMQARIERAEATAVHRYIPRSLSADLNHWLRDSLLAGHAENASMRLKGPLDKFPFRHGEGEFLIHAQARQILMAYAPDWPAIEALNGSLEFEAARMSIRTEGGRIFGTELGKVAATVADLEAPQLVVEGEASGPTQEFLRFVNSSPIAHSVGYFTRSVQARGDGRLQLHLEVPLENAEATRVRGEYRFAANRLKLREELPELEEAGARLVFTEKSLGVQEGNARFLGTPLAISGDTRSDGAMVIDARGSLGVRQLAEWMPSPLWAQFTGETPISLRVAVRESEVLASLDSSLLGIASSLPDPFNKVASTTQPLRLEWRWQSGKDGALRQSVGARYADTARAELQFDAGVDGQPVLRRGAVSLGAAPLAVPEQGLRLRADLPRLDLDAWSRTRASEGTAGSLPPLDTLELKLGSLVARGYVFDQQRLVAQRKDERWDVQLAGPDAEGSLSWSPAGAGFLRARLSQLALRPLAGEKTRADSPRPARAASAATTPLPDLDLAITDLHLGPRALGSLQVRGMPSAEGWVLKRLALANPDGELEAWGRQFGQPLQSELRFTLDTSDAGQLITRVGYPGLIRQGKAQLSGALDWRGGLRDFDYPGLSGDVRLDASAGLFPKVNPGVGGRLLGVLSLQSLRRRMNLDFQDVFAEGFAFDKISGSMKLDGGILRTEDFLIQGPAAQVSMRGTANLAAETQSLEVRVQPTLSETVAVGAAIAPAIGTLNPLVGVAAYLAQKVLSDPVERIFALEYSVEGSWADPVVRKRDAARATAREGN
ncbi:YhdP family protein [Niveibacterium sp. SC-1]|uniref:YhdP family protein n=1 Tax=Niveibacterium sp. SC-1 TaxID=3135646 RepID=UPI00311EB2C1